MLKTFCQPPTGAELLYGVKCLMAAGISLFIALKLGLPRPFWAPMASCIVANSLSSGSIMVRCTCRLIGTIVGCSVAVVLLISFINYTLLLSLFIALWVGVAMYFAMIRRTTDNYVFVVGGFTVPVIIFGIIGNLDLVTVDMVWYMAIARTEETAIGILSSTFIHSLVFPRLIGPVVNNRLDAVWKDICNWVDMALHGKVSLAESQKAGAAMIITNLRQMSADLPYDSSHARLAVDHIRLLQDRMTAIVPTISAIEESVSDLRKAGKLNEYWTILLDNITSWAIRTDNTPESARWLRNHIRRGLPEITPQSTWDQITLVRLAADLSKLITYCENHTEQRKTIDECISGKAVHPPRALPVSIESLHKDRKLAFLVSLSAVFTIVVSSVLWVISGWGAGFCAPMMASIFYMIFVRGNNSVSVVKIVLWFTMYSLPPAGFYLLIGLYSTHSYEMLMMILAPTVILVSVYISRPATSVGMTIFMMGIWSTLTMYDLDMANATSFINGQSIAQCAGVAMALVSAMIFRSFDYEWTTKRLLGGIAEDISKLSRAVRAPSIIQTTVKLVDRISTLTPRLSIFGNQKEHMMSFLFRQMRSGISMVYLMHMKSRLAQNGIDIQPLVESVSDYYADTAHGDDKKQAVLEQIDETIRQVCRMDSPVRQHAAIAALAGIRQNIFPDAPRYYSQTLASKETV